MEERIESEPKENTQKTEKKTTNKKHYIIFSALIIFLTLIVYLTWISIQKYGKSISKPTENKITEYKTENIQHNEKIEDTYSYEDLHSRVKSIKEKAICDSEEYKTNPNSIIIFLKSEGENTTSLWYADSNGCNKKEIHTNGNVCAIKEFSPDKRNLLLELCEKKPLRGFGGVTGKDFNYVKVAILNVESKKITEIATILDLPESEYVVDYDIWDMGWNGNDAVWYYYFDEEDFQKKRNEILSLNTDDSEIYQTLMNAQDSKSEVALYLIEQKYFKSKNTGFLRKVTLDGMDSIILYPFSKLLNHNKPRFFTKSNAGDNNLSMYFVEYPKEKKTISVWDIDSQSGYLNYSFETKVDDVTIDDLKNHIHYDLRFSDQVNENKIELTTHSFSGLRALYPDSTCQISSLDSNPIIEKGIVYISQYSMYEWAYKSTDPALINLYIVDLSGVYNQRANPYTDCSNYIILDTSNNTLEPINFLCEEGEICYSAVIL